MTQRIESYQTGTFTLGNRLLDADQRGVQATIERRNALTPGHRACPGRGETLGARPGREAIRCARTACQQVSAPWSTR